MGKKEVGKKERGKKEKKIAQQTNIIKPLTARKRLQYVRDVCFLFSQHTRSYHQGDVYLSLMAHE